MGVEDPFKVADIFQNLSFRPVATVRKNRIIYNLRELIITLDEVHGCRYILWRLKKKLKKVKTLREHLKRYSATYSEIGIEDGFERRSYLELMGIQ